MIQGIYAVYDSAAAVFCRPFYVPNDAVALRSFAAGANDRSTELGRHPEDFTLFKLGEFNDVKGVIVAYPQQINLGKGASHVRENASESVNDEAHVLAGAESRDSSLKLRPFPRPQDNV